MEKLESFKYSDIRTITGAWKVLNKSYMRRYDGKLKILLLYTLLNERFVFVILHGDKGLTLEPKLSNHLRTLMFVKSKKRCLNRFCGISFPPPNSVSFSLFFVISK